MLAMSIEIVLEGSEFLLQIGCRPEQRLVQVLPDLRNKWIQQLS
jgi:hypothetical protein